jgi:hypothetical protein
MHKPFEQNQAGVVSVPTPDKISQIRQELSRRIQLTLQISQNLSADACLQQIRGSLWAIQSYCKTIHKAFIVVEMQIHCDQYNIGGRKQDAATLFRGPNEDASVAICVTSKGSLLYRNGDRWKVYRNMGDVNPVESLAISG